MTYGKGVKFNTDCTYWNIETERCDLTDENYGCRINCVDYEPPIGSSENDLILEGLALLKLQLYDLIDDNEVDAVALGIKIDSIVTLINKLKG